MIEIFKTNVEMREHAAALITGLNALVPEACINFDLEDCDRILRIEASFIPHQLIQEWMQSRGYNCEVLV